MQLLSQASLGPEAQRLFEEVQKSFAPVAAPAAWTAVALVFGGAILSAWLASQMVVKERAGLGRAFGAGILITGAFLLISALVVAALYFAMAQGSVKITTGALVIGGLLFLYAGLSIPMGVYRMHLGKAFGFLVVALIVQAAIQVAALQLSHDPLRLRAHAEQAQRIYHLEPGARADVVRAIRSGFGVAPSEPGSVAQAPSPSGSETPVAVPVEAKSLEQRQSELTVIYNDLQTRRAALQPGDQAGLEAYTRDNAHYLELLEQLQKDAGSAAPNAAP